MKSSIVYKLFDSGICLHLKNHGYKKHKTSMLGYSKEVDEHSINFWVQCSREGFNQYRGGKFIIQFSITEEAEIRFSGLDGGRIPKYLTSKELEEVRQVQNDVISRLEKLPHNFFLGLAA